MAKRRKPDFRERLTTPTSAREILRQRKPQGRRNRPQNLRRQLQCRQRIRNNSAVVLLASVVCCWIMIAAFSLQCSLANKKISYVFVSGLQTIRPIRLILQRRRYNRHQILPQQQRVLRQRQLWWEQLRSSRLSASSSQPDIPPEIGGDEFDGSDYYYPDGSYPAGSDGLILPPPYWESEEKDDDPRNNHLHPPFKDNSDINSNRDVVNPFPFPQPKSPSVRSSSQGAGANKHRTGLKPAAVGSTAVMTADNGNRPSLLDEYEFDKLDFNSTSDDGSGDLSSSLSSSSSSSSSSSPVATESVVQQIKLGQERSRSDIAGKNTENITIIGIQENTTLVAQREQFASILEHPDQGQDRRDGVSVHVSSLSPSNVAIVPEISGGGDNTNKLTPQEMAASLKVRIDEIESEIWTMSKNNPFNLNSPKQVSVALFGRPDMSTNKNILEGIAGQNILAKLILEHRQFKSQYNKLTKRLDAQQKQRKKHEEQQKQCAASITNNMSTPARTRDTTSYNDAYYRSVPVTKEDPILLVDLSSLIFRAYYSMPPIHRPVDGMPVGAVMGFCNMLNRLVLNDLLRGKQPRLVLCCDADTSKTKTFRHDMYSDYKGHRPPLPLDLIPQFALISQMANAYGIPQVQAEGYEADDVIATLATQACFKEGLPVRILSSDKDLMQLITNRTIDSFAVDWTDSKSGDDTQAFHNIHMIDPATMTPWTHETVVEKWGVPAHQLGDVLALAGDTADNVPGVPGIGPKIAAQLLQEFGSLEELLDRTDEVPQKGRRSKLETYKEQAMLSKDLVRLVCDLEPHQMQMISPDQDGGDMRWKNLEDIYGNEIHDSWEVGNLRTERMDADRILRLYAEMGFVTIKERLLERLKRQSIISYGDNHFEERPIIQKQSSHLSAAEHKSTMNIGRKHDYEHASPFTDDDFEDIEGDEDDCEENDDRKCDEGGGISLEKTRPTDVVCGAGQCEDTAQKKKTKKKKQYVKKKWAIPSPEDFSDVPF